MRSINAIQKHLGYKKVWGQSEASLQTRRHVRPRTLISAEAKKKIMLVQKGGQVTKPIIHTCENML